VADRLGYQGADDVLAPPWLATVTLDALANRALTPPWRPQLDGADDGKYFDQAAFADDYKRHAADVAKELSDEKRGLFGDEFGEFIDAPFGGR